MPDAVGADRAWALPGSPRDRVIRILKVALPIGAALLLVTLVLLPLTSDREFSFVLAKDRVDEASERMRVDAATYRGETNDGRPFELTAGSAIQRTSDTPEVELRRLSARIDGRDGRSIVSAPSGRYDMRTDRLRIAGPVRVDGASGYGLEGEAVDVDIRARTVRSDNPVTGDLPIGTFAAGRMQADVGGRVVVLEGGARLRITPGTARGRG